MAPAGLLTQRKLPAPPRHREQRLRALHYVPVDPIPWCRTSRIRSLKRHPDSFALTITNVAGAEEDKPRRSIKAAASEKASRLRPPMRWTREPQPPTAGRMSSPSQAHCRYAMHIRPIFVGSQQHPQARPPVAAGRYDNEAIASGMAATTSSAVTQMLVRRFAAARAARACSAEASTHASTGVKPCASSAAAMPASTSPVPAFAKAEVPSDMRTMVSPSDI